MVDPEIESVFPGLRGQPYQITNPIDRKYNCIAFAVGDTQTWWWPDEAEEDTWPAHVPRVETVPAFREVFAMFGYADCAREELEPGFEKVALFTLAGVPKHAARQLGNGRWTSKLGPKQDIEHALHDLTGLLYGSVALIMKRPAALR